MEFIFDTETTSFVRDKLPLTHDNQPYCVQLASVLQTPDASRSTIMNTIIDNGDIDIPQASTDVHGISQKEVDLFGIRAKHVIEDFILHVAKADTIIAHNIDFDIKVMMIFAHRHGYGDALRKMFDKREILCTMDLATDIVKLPPTERMIAAGMGHLHKRPTVDECIQFFFGERLEDAHNAMADVNATVRIYNEIKRRADAGEI